MCSDVDSIQHIIILHKYKVPFLIESISCVLIVSLVLVQRYIILFTRRNETHSKFLHNVFKLKNGDKKTKLAKQVFVCDKGLYCWQPAGLVEIILPDTNHSAAMGFTPLQ